MSLSFLGKRRIFGELSRLTRAKSLICLMLGWTCLAFTFVDGDVSIFTREKWLPGELWEEPEEMAVYLFAGPQGLQILDEATKEPLFSIHWGSVRRLNCSCSRYLRARQLAFLLNLLNLPHLPLHGKKHWLELEHDNRTTILRLHKGTRKAVVTEIEERTGLKCERIELE